MIGINLIGIWRSNKAFKAKSGWVAYLNPKNWGVNDYDTEEFSEAFAKARHNGDKVFLWNGNRYNTKLIKPESLESFDEQYEYIKDKINNLTIDDIKLNKKDSVDAHLYSYNKDNLLRDSLGIDTYLNNYSYYSDLKLEYKLNYLDSIREYKLNDIKNRFNQLNRRLLVVTDLPKKGYNTLGYYDRRNGKIYLNLNSPGIAIHEISHYTHLDEVPGIHINKELVIETLRQLVKHPNKNYIKYSSNPYEIGARFLQKLYLLLGKNYLDSKSILEDNPVDAVIYNENNFNAYFK